MDESLALLRQISLSLQALSLEVHRQGQVLSRVQELVDELHPGADYEVVSQSPGHSAVANPATPHPSRLGPGASGACASPALPSVPAFPIGAPPASSASPAAGYSGAEGSEVCHHRGGETRDNQIDWCVFSEVLGWRRSRHLGQGSESSPEPLLRSGCEL
eukprot:s2359_g11.t1